MTNLLTNYKETVLAAYHSSISTNIKTLLNDYHLSQKNIADALFVSSQLMTDILSGHRNITLYFLFQFSAFFCVSIDWLIGRSHIKYSELLMQTFEEECQFNLPGHKWFGKLYDNEFILHPDSVPDRYRNLTDRNQYYSLEERAKIITTINIIVRLKKYELVGYLEDELMDLDYKDRHPKK